MSAGLLKNQYELLKGSRQVLLAYCDTITPENFTRELDGFGHGSISSVLAHIANTYIHWLQNFAMSRSVAYIDDGVIMTVDEARRLFKQTDTDVDEFIISFANKLDIGITAYVRSGTQLTLTPLTLFTHVLTHEAHHKGQILSMSRQMGYVPVDTDVIRS